MGTFNTSSHSDLQQCYQAITHVTMATRSHIGGKRNLQTSFLKQPTNTNPSNWTIGTGLTHGCPWPRPVSSFNGISLFCSSDSFHITLVHMPMIQTGDCKVLWFSTQPFCGTYNLFIYLPFLDLGGMVSAQQCTAAVYLPSTELLDLCMLLENCANTLQRQWPP